MLTRYKINRIVTAKRMGVPPSYLDEAGDAWHPDGIDIRAHEFNDILKVMHAARIVEKDGIKVW